MSSTTAPPPTRTERVRTEGTDRLEAALIGAGPHVEPVLDVGTTERGDLLLVLPEPAARLADLAAVPGWPVAGEAVTVLVPLAQALAGLHRAGVALTAADAGSVVLDADGSPAWCVPPRPVLLRRAGAAAFSAAVDDDRRRFREFALALVAASGRTLHAPPDAGPEALVDALFDVADPCPVRLRPAAADPVDPGALPSRLVQPPSAAEPAGGDAVVARVRGLLAPLRTVRRRVWASAAAAVAGLVLAAALLPGGGADAVVAASAPPTRASAPASPPAAGPVAPRGLPGIDAVRRLLHARAGCLASGSAACLDAVDAPGSPVHAADRAAVRSGAAPVLPAVQGLRVLSQGGGTVMADVRGTVVVAVRQAAGGGPRAGVAPPPR